MPVRQEQLFKGQFYTPSAVCDMMLALALQTGKESLLEPGCGAGIFLQRAADLLKNHFRRTEAQIIQQLSGIEIDADAFAQAQASWQQTGFTQPLNLHHMDFLSEEADSLGPFDIIIGNPPYVRQELLKQSFHMSKQSAQSYLQKKYAHFSEFRALVSKKPDLYIWFFLQAASLLKPGGTLAFITSNSWLNTALGKIFQQFLMQQFELCFLLESACEQWFADASVNSVIVILKKKTAISQTQIQPVRVLRFSQPLQSWLPRPGSPLYWQNLKQQLTGTLQQKDEGPDCVCHVRTIPAALFLNGSGKTLPLKTNDEPRIKKAGWAFLMRAPQDLPELLQKEKCWASLSDLGTVRYPLKTGINQFFYLSRQQAERWKIEPRFLVPMVKSIRPLRRYELFATDCEMFLFSCSETEAVLKEKALWGAYNYIAWGTRQLSRPRQKRSGSVPWPQVVSVKNNRPWYAIKPLPSPQILCSRFYDRRFFFPLCRGELVEDQTFYGLMLQDWQPEFVAGLLNSTFIFSLLEFTGRNSLGEGVLQFSRADMAELPVPNPALYTSAQRDEVADAFRQLALREVQPIEQEVLLADRAALDMAVLRPLLEKAGWPEAPDDFRKRLIEQLLARMHERILKAKSSRRVGAIVARHPQPEC